MLEIYRQTLEGSHDFCPGMFDRAAQCSKRVVDRFYHERISFSDILNPAKAKIAFAFSNKGTVIIVERPSPHFERSVHFNLKKETLHS